MAIKISSKYLEKLAEIKKYLTGVANRSFQEHSRLFPTTNQGRCCYDYCSKKSVKANRMIIIEKGKRTDVSYFHASCIDALMKDKRFPGLN